MNPASLAARYLTEVLARVNDHPASKLDELLPHKWRGPPADVVADWLRTTGHDRAT